MNYCNKCGSMLKAGDVYCSTCGNRTAPTSASAATVGSGRSKLIAGLLAIFLGGWGVHNFYLGHIGRGIAQIAVTMVTFGVGGIWGFIEGILILCDRITVDADGNPLLP